MALLADVLKCSFSYFLLVFGRVHAHNCQMFCQNYSRVMEELCWWIECNVWTVASMGPYAYCFTERYIKPRCLVELWIGRAVTKLLPVSLFLLRVRSYYVIINCMCVLQSSEASLRDSEKRQSSCQAEIHDSISNEYPRLQPVLCYELSHF